ncbi:hypothetical protein EOD42_14340 [Rhodovarius crocodyli]|uniref:Uncharacterized protein n=1 Tax=Rhodovarius crocodyli TaxID=1979269 RepID=A0A437MF87_9PROT|nr:hypothetical protein [Rhodovarius crocodyli]RVT96286.1 hypothetical protein EOD42_14340 [Rhodovarius crocodyli]
MKRADALNAIRAAGAQGDQQAFMRLYVENRVSKSAADAAWREGQNLARFVKQRDAKEVSRDPVA